MNASYRFVVYRTGFHSNDGYTAYLELGSPTQLTETQIAHLNDLTKDAPETDKVVRSTADGTIETIFPMSSNDILLVKLMRNWTAQ